MTHKRCLHLASASLATLILAATALPVYAADPSTTSTDTVTFNPPDSSTTLPNITVPVDPNDPTGATNTITPTPGELELDKATDVNFGTHTMDGSTTTFVAQASDNGGSSGDFTPYVTWHDLRGANSPAFKIFAATSGFTDLTTATTIPLGAGTAKNITPAPSGGTAPTDVSSVTPAGALTLTNDGQTNLIASDSGAVSGYYADYFASSTLSCPVADQSSGSHTATITWTLTLD